MKYTVYILHFNIPYIKSGKAFRHYVGYTKDLDKRLRLHREGRGSKWVKFMLQHGSDFVVSRTWEFDTQQDARRKEIKIKNGHASKYCPLCTKQKSKQ